MSCYTTRFAIYAWFTLTVSAKASCPLIDKLGLATTDFMNDTLVCHTAYMANVNKKTLVPKWVAYQLTAEHTLGCFKRKDNFHSDEQLTALQPPIPYAKPGDYSKSGYDMGHQAPAEDFAWSEETLSDSFSMANMAPQLPGFNRQGWERGEEYVRAWAWRRKLIDVYVGPILTLESKTIGEDHIAIPVSFWKVLYDPAAEQSFAFIMPQHDEPKGPLDQWATSINNIETITGIKLPIPFIDKREIDKPWVADLVGWRKAHIQACEAKP